MKKIFQLCAAVAVMFAVTGCYNDFDSPTPGKVYTDGDFSDMQHISIADVKGLFNTEHGTISGTGENSSWNDTKYTQVGRSSDGKEYYIKGKVQSSDEEGNIYKSLHLVDDTGAIEVKLSTGLYIDYPMGRFDQATGKIPTHWVYVKISDLFVGNYRMMLSLGNGPTDSYNKVGEHKHYANSNIENPTEIDRRVFLGAAAELTLGEEILEITQENYNEFYGETGQQYLGRLVIIRDVTCRYGSVGTNIYPSWMYTDVRPVASKVWYKWAFSEEGTNLYGSVLFTYGDAVPAQTLEAGVYTVRTSGYSRFAKYPVVRDGARGDILAIFGIYSKSWTYSFGAYQCSVNYFQDILFDKDQFLTAEEVLEMTPNGYPDNDPSKGDYNEANDSWSTPDTTGSDYEE